MKAFTQILRLKATTTIQATLIYSPLTTLAQILAVLLGKGNL